MNTIFKFYYQAWLIWGTMAAYAIWALLRRPLLRRPATILWALPTLVLLVGALVYPYATLKETPVTPQPEIDALAFVRQYGAPGEQEALTWIEQNTKPSDVILTVIGEDYQPDTARVSAATGRATLLGWNGSHEQLWRGGSPEIMDEIHNRERDIPAIYNVGLSDDEVVKLLAHYNVRYVYVGPVERSKYNGTDRFGQFMNQVFAQGDVQIYQRR